MTPGNDFKDEDGDAIPGSMFEAVDNRFDQFRKEERETIREALEESDDVEFETRKDLLEEIEEARN